MSSSNRGGSAFPGFANCFEEGRGNFQKAVRGMSLRDWFAGRALTGLIINPRSLSEVCPLSARAYEIADAMLAAREGSEK